jgi:hypothetical protein
MSWSGGTLSRRIERHGSRRRHESRSSAADAGFNRSVTLPINEKLWCGRARSCINCAIAKSVAFLSSNPVDFALAIGVALGFAWSDELVGAKTCELASKTGNLRQSFSREHFAVAYFRQAN